MKTIIFIVAAVWFILVGIVIGSIVTPIMISDVPVAYKLYETSSGLGNIELPEEIGEAKQGDTLVISINDSKIRIWFYHSDYEMVEDCNLYIVE